MGHSILHHMEVETTNRIARDLAEGGAPEGTVVVGEVQTGGKGRRGRTWISPKGGIWLSVVLRPRLPPSRAPLLTLGASWAVANALREMLPELAISIKWPNDVLVGEKKVCGILSEVAGELDCIEYAIIGIGVNANFKMDTLPGDLHGTATTLLHEAGQEVDRQGLTVSILRQLDELYCKEPQAIISGWKETSSTIGRRVRIDLAGGRDPVEGTAVDLSPDGALVLRKTDGKEIQIFAGDCVHLEGRG
jgi:BirA family biotin operon repressor/biotin-[acetyl-CoA-carboxylase] ligase